VGEDPDQHVSVALRRVVGAAPASGREELVRGGLQGSQVGQVLPGTLVGRRVELEVDLVEAGGEENLEPIAICAPVRTLVEALRQAEVEEGRRSGVEPALGEPEVTGDDRAASARGAGSGSAGRRARPSTNATMSTSRVTREVSPRTSSAAPPTTARLRCCSRSVS